MKFYVAGPTNEIKNVKEVQQILTDGGHSITFDWTKRVEELGDAHVVPVPYEARRKGAYLDRDGIIEADGLIAWLTPDCLGTLIEIGIATQLEKPTLLLCPDPATRMSIFYDMDHITYEHLEDEPTALLIETWMESEL